MRRIALASISLLLCALVTVPAYADDSDDARFAQHCPGFATWKKAHPELSKKNRAKRIAAGDPTQPQLRQQLLDMVKSDQAARDAWTKVGLKTGQGGQVELERTLAVDAGNLKKLRPIIERQGFPTPAQVGMDGVDAAFLLVQHADADPAFQLQVLPQLEALYKQGFVSGQDVAMLTDRTLRAQGKPQRYGTQYISDDRHPEMKLQPVEDFAGLDARRASMGMPSLVDYACVLSVAYNKPVRPGA